MDSLGGSYYDGLSGNWVDGGSNYDDFSQGFTQDGTPIYSNPPIGCSSQQRSPAPDHFDENPEIREEIEEIKSPDYHKWTHEEEVELIEAMKIAKLCNHKSPQGFKKTGWNCMLAHMKIKFPNTKLTEANIMNHVKTWRKLYICVLDLKSQSGTGWCDVTNTFECTPEAWKEGCKKHGKLLLGKRKKSWEFYLDWVEIYGTDRAAGKKVNDFHSAAMKVLAHDRYKTIISDSVTLNEEGIVETSTNVQDASESTGGSKRRRRRGNDFEIEFIEQMKSIVGVSGIGEDGKDVRTRRIEGLDGELKKYPQLMIRDRLMIGDIIVNGVGKLEHFYSLSEEDREEYVKVELSKLGKPGW